MFRGKTFPVWAERLPNERGYIILKLMRTSAECVIDCDVVVFFVLFCAKDLCFPRYMYCDFEIMRLRNVHENERNQRKEAELAAERLAELTAKYEATHEGWRDRCDKR